VTLETREAVANATVQLSAHDEGIHQDAERPRSWSERAEAVMKMLVFMRREYHGPFRAPGEALGCPMARFAGRFSARGEDPGPPKRCRRNGWDVLRAVDTFPEGTQDDLHFARAAQRERVMVSCDRDVRRLAVQWLRQGRHSRGLTASTSTVEACVARWFDDVAVGATMANFARSLIEERSTSARAASSTDAASGR
jgi:hypothetical protein